MNRNEEITTLINDIAVLEGKLEEAIGDKARCSGLPTLVAKYTDQAVNFEKTIQRKMEILNMLTRDRA